MQLNGMLGLCGIRVAVLHFGIASTSIVCIHIIVK